MESFTQIVLFVLLTYIAGAISNLSKVMLKIAEGQQQLLGETRRATLLQLNDRKLPSWYRPQYDVTTIKHEQFVSLSQWKNKDVWRSYATSLCHAFAYDTDVEVMFYLEPTEDEQEEAKKYSIFISGKWEVAKFRKNTRENRLTLIHQHTQVPERIFFDAQGKETSVFAG